MNTNVTLQDARTEALDKLGVMDTSPDEHLNAIVAAAALACDVPISLISLLDSERQWFKANFGLTGIKQTPRKIAFCHHTIQQDEVLEVCDAQEDLRFINNPLVIEHPGIRFYAGVPLTLPDDHRIGSLCVMDKQPRKLTNEQRKILQQLAIAASHILRTSKLARQACEYNARLEALSAAAPLGVLVTNADLECTYTNGRLRSIFGLDKEAVSGHGWATTIQPDDRRLVLEEWSNATAQGTRIETRFCILRPGGDVVQIRLLAHPFVGLKGEFNGMVAAVEDITMRRRQEQALHKSQRLLKHTGALADVGGWVLDISSGQLTWSEQICHIHGVSSDYQPTLSAAIGFYAQESQPVIRAAVQRAIDHGVGWDLELQLIRADGQQLWVHAVGNIEYENNKPVTVFGAIQNVTQKVQQRQAIEFAHDRMALATDSGNIGIWEWDITTDKLSWTALMYKLYGLQRNSDPLSFDIWRNLLHPDDRVRAEKTLIRSLACGIDLEGEFRIVRADGQVRHMRASARISRDNTGKAVRVVGVNWDITQICSLTSTLAEQHALMHVTLQSIGDAVITTGTSGYITWLNPAAEKMTGWSIENAVNRPISQIFNIVDADTGQVAPNPIMTCLEHRQRVSLTGNTVLKSLDGSRYGIQESAAPIRDEHNTVLGAVLVFHDVTEQRRLSSEMTYRAMHDSLTGLLNRTEFENRVSNALTSARTQKDEDALFFVDLDQFKLVNDACGHDKGDQLLQQIAELIMSSVRAEDSVARLGGDEFGVLLRDCSIDAAKDIAQGLCNRMDEFRFIHKERRFRIGTSIGLVPLKYHWSDVADIMQAADVACFAAKDAGRNRVHIWFDTDDNMNMRSSQMKWATQLEQALDDNMFVLFAQRLEKLTEKEPGLHFEVLLRMYNQHGKLVQPETFLPAAERFHLATRIDRWVLKHAVDKLLGLQHPCEVSTICINLSGQSVSDRVFHHDTVKLLENAGDTVCRQICIEITETAVVTNMADASVFIDQLHALGVRVALDDFGAGASSFGYLRSLNVDTLKIDGQFIKNMLHEPLDAAAVRCFIDVARIQGLQTVAEYVSNDCILQHVRRMGIDFAQGYLLHRPEPIDELLESNRRKLQQTPAIIQRDMAKGAAAAG